MKYIVECATKGNMDFPENAYHVNSLKEVEEILKNVSNKDSGIETVFIYIKHKCPIEALDKGEHDESRSL